MPGYISIDKRYTNWNAINLNGENYQVLDPKKMFLDLIKYSQTPIEWDMKNIILIGPQNSGKTVLIRYLVHLIRNNPDYKGLVSVLRTNDLRIIGDKRYKNYFINPSTNEAYKVLVIVVDDVVREGFDSRRSMSGANVEITQQFCVTRHILEENYSKNGIIFMIFASQMYFRLDATIRDTAQLQIFTSYYDKSWFHDLFSPDDAEILRIATYEGMFGSNFDARRFAICKTLTGDTATIEVPFSTKEEVPYDYIDRSVDKNIIINRLSNVLLEKLDDLSDFTKGELKGFLGLEAKRIENDYCIKLNKSDFTTAIDRALFILKVGKLNSDRDQGIEIHSKNGMFQITCPECENTQDYRPQNMDIIFKNPRSNCKVCGLKFYINKDELFTRKSPSDYSKILDNMNPELKGVI